MIGYSQFSVIVGVFVFISLTTEASIVQQSTYSECNDYVDRVIADLKNDKGYFEDPHKVPEKTFGISKKVLFINYTGEISITEGYIFGTTSLHRDGDVIVDKKKATHLKIYLGAGELKMECKGKIKLMGHGPSIKVDAKVSYVNMKLDIVPKSKDGRYPKVSKFDIETAKGQSVKISGLGPLNILLNSMIRTMGTVFKRFIRSGLEGRITRFLADKFKDYVIPEECLSSGFD